MAYLCAMRDKPGVELSNDLAPPTVTVITQPIIAPMRSDVPVTPGSGSAHAYGFVA